MLGDIADIYLGLWLKTSDTNTRQEGVPVVTVRSLSDFGVDGSDVDWAELTESKITKHRVEPGDVLIAARSTSLRTGVVPEDFPSHAVINSTLIGVRLDANKLHPRLLVAWLNTPTGMNSLVESSQSGTAQMSIGSGRLKEMVVPLFPLAQQDKLVSLLEAADETYRASVDAADKRRLIARQAVTNLLIAREMKSNGNESE
nr:restriction endonuclease subunit S [Rhodopirellula sp. JC740]